jgi:hypothetical protein
MKRNKTVYRLLFILTLLGTVGTNTASAQTTKVIYFLSGPKDHAWNGRHETEKDLLVLQRCIDSITNIKGVKIVTKFIAKRTEHDINDIKDAAAIIIECSSESSTTKFQTNPLFPANTSPKNNTYDKDVLAYLNQLDSLHKAGMGIMILHWGIATDNQRARDYYISWFGGSSMPNYTQNPLGFWSITPMDAGKKHPIMQGVGAWTYKDEIFSRLVVTPGDEKHRTNLLMGETPRSNMGAIAPRCVAWAYQDGLSRGLLWGGMDYHAGLLDENYRRFLMNAIVWTAGIEVPKGGVKSSAKGLQIALSRPDEFDKLK